MSEEAARALVASEAAWLARVNDDRVRAWFKHPHYPPTPDGGPRKTTTWDELAAFCTRMRKRAPHPLALLDLDAHAVDRLLAGSGNEGDGPEVGGSDVGKHHTAGDGATVRALQDSLARARVREDGLRRTLREYLAAVASAQDLAGAQRRAVAEMLDSSEQLTRLDDSS